MTKKPMKKIALPFHVVSEILNASPDATIISDQEGKIRAANKAAELLFGFAADELIGELIEVLVPVEQHERHRGLRDSYQKAPRARPMVSGLEIFAVRKDGSSFRAEIGLNPIETNDGLLVTSTIRTINKMDDSEAYFRNVLESAPDAMIIIDEQGKIAIVNAQAEKMFGYDRQEILGCRIETLLPERLREQHVSHRGEFVRDPKLRPMGVGLDLIARRRNGSEFPVEISLSPVRTGARGFVSSVIRDVTERKRMQDEICLLYTSPSPRDRS